MRTSVSSFVIALLAAMLLCAARAQDAPVPCNPRVASADIVRQLRLMAGSCTFGLSGRALG